LEAKVPNSSEEGVVARVTPQGQEAVGKQSGLAAHETVADDSVQLLMRRIGRKFLLSENWSEAEVVLAVC
jgi:hypothetical protein